MKSRSEITIVADSDLAARLPSPEEFKRAIFCESMMNISKVDMTKLKVSMFLFAEEVEEEPHPFTFHEANAEVERRWGRGSFSLAEDRYPMSPSGKTCFLQENVDPFHVVRGDTWEDAIMAWHIYTMRED